MATHYTELMAGTEALVTTLGIFSANKGVIPVSYTHLDVYKRQAAGYRLSEVQAWIRGEWHPGWKPGKTKQQ